jgi:hypothetical protein
MKKVMSTEASNRKFNDYFNYLGRKLIITIKKPRSTENKNRMFDAHLIIGLLDCQNGFVKEFFI